MVSVFSLRNNDDVKTLQSLMRHANSNITTNAYIYAVSSKNRQAQSLVVEMIRGFSSPFCSFSRVKPYLVSPG